MIWLCIRSAFSYYMCIAFYGNSRRTFLVCCLWIACHMFYASVVYHCTVNALRCILVVMCVVSIIILMCRRLILFDTAMMYVTQSYYNIFLFVFFIILLFRRCEIWYNHLWCDTVDCVDITDILCRTNTRRSTMSLQTNWMNNLWFWNEREIIRSSVRFFVHN